MYGAEDTIVAVSTPVGEGGIGIVRLSGAQAVEVARALFVGAHPDLDWQSHRLYYGHVIDPVSGKRIDEVLVSSMRRPHSYTREDVVEFNCHGGVMPLQEILRLCLRQGARQALPGEFTLRAFLNGRLDLSQAEAVLDVIRAKTDTGLRAAMRQLDGQLSNRVSSVRQRLLAVLAYLTASIDFAEQEVPLQDIGPDLAVAQAELESLLVDAERGVIYRHGIRAVLVGRPNVGKSSLLNALLRVNRAIVTPVPGTTRDTLEETLNLRGMPLVLIDTAGLNDAAQDVVERLGIERSLAALDQADLILWVIDASTPLREADRAIAERLPGRAVVTVLNKSDLPAMIEADALPLAAPWARVCAVTGEGLSELEDTIVETIFGERLNPSEFEVPLVNSPRHKNAIERALGQVRVAQGSYAASMAADFITIDLTAACDALGEITGESVAEDLLETIFSRFCIGK